MENQGLRRSLQAGIVAGAAGGVAEIAWIILYGAATGAETEPVARGVAATFFPSLSTSSEAIWIGILIHLALAVALGLTLALALRYFKRSSAGFSQFGIIVLALAAIWAVNFLIALPRLNPEFVRLLPYEVTLLSKLLFGMSAATVLLGNRRLKARR